MNNKTNTNSRIYGMSLGWILDLSYCLVFYDIIPDNILPLVKINIKLSTDKISTLLKDYHNSTIFGKYKLYGALDPIKVKIINKYCYCIS